MTDDRNDAMARVLEIIGKTGDEARLVRKRAEEKHRADALAADAAAYREMPTDLKERAKAWGVSALMDAVWLNAFGCGYKQALRDQTEARGRSDD